MSKRLLLLSCALVLAVGVLMNAAAADAQGDPELAPELYIYNWADYIDPEVIAEYEDTYGVRVTYDNFATNEELFARMQAGAEYDVIFPTDYMIFRMIELGQIVPLDKENIPNFANVDPFNLDNWFDPGGVYCVPNTWGTTGIAYRADLERVPTGWDAVYDPEQAAYYAEQGGINLLDDSREVIGDALLYLGYPLDDEDPEHLAEVRDLVINILPYVEHINATDYQDTLLIPGEVVLSVSWDGSTIRAAMATQSDEYPEGMWKHLIPKEGAPVWQDGMCIPANSPRKATAEHFINFLLEPENAARTAKMSGYMPANMAAYDLIPQEIHAMLPNEEQRKTLQWFRPLSEEGLLLWDQTWTEIRASQ